MTLASQAATRLGGQWRNLFRRIHRIRRSAAIQTNRGCADPSKKMTSVGGSHSYGALCTRRLDSSSKIEFPVPEH